MKKNIFDYGVTLLVIALIFFSGYWLGQSRFAPVTLTGAASDTPADLRAEFRPFWETWELINTRYFDQPVDSTMLVEGAIEGMLATLEDPNTLYMSPTEQAQAEEAMSGEFQGIGAEVTSNDEGAIVIVSPFEGSPAAAAGLRPGDILREADGTPLTGMDVGEAASIVRGPADTDVTLLIQRDEELFEVVITRGVIELPSVRGEMLDNDIAYLRLSRFGDRTVEEFSQTLEELMNNNPDGLILDLRGNPGGALDAVVEIADEFLPAGAILLERFGDGNQVDFNSEDGGLAESVPLAVLIDQGSASASEVLAGAIRDQGRGVLVGVDSFGKGTVQSWQPLSNGGGVRITIARWLTPNGTWVHETGLQPDIEVELPEFEPGEELDDTQLEAAIDYFNNQQTGN